MQINWPYFLGLLFSGAGWVFAVLAVVCWVIGHMCFKG